MKFKPLAFVFTLSLTLCSIVKAEGPCDGAESAFLDLNSISSQYIIQAPFVDGQKTTINTPIPAQLRSRAMGQILFTVPDSSETLVDAEIKFEVASGISLSNFFPQFAVGKMNGTSTACNTRFFSTDTGYLLPSGTATILDFTQFGSNDGNNSVVISTDLSASPGASSSTGYDLTLNLKVIPGNEYEATCGVVKDGNSEFDSSFPCDITITISGSSSGDDGNNGDDEGGEDTPDDPEPVPEVPGEPVPEEVECAGSYGSLGLQPVAGVLQDDKRFKKHSAVDLPNEKEIGDGPISYSLSLDDPKDLIANRKTLLLARAPSYTKIKDFTEVLFAGESNYSKMVETEITFTAEDSTGVIMEYKSPIKVKGPFGEPCIGEPEPFALVYKIPKAIAKNPQPPAFEPSTGAALIDAVVRKVEDDSFLMSTETNFEVSTTTIGKIILVPVTEKITGGKTEKIKKRNAKDQKKHEATHKKNIKTLADSLSKIVPDHFPLASRAINAEAINLTVALPFEPVVGDKNGKALARSKNFFKTRRVGDIIRKHKASSKADIVISVIDSQAYRKVTEPGSVAFALTGGGINKPSFVTVQTTRRKRKLRNSIAKVRAEDTIHEIAHSYGFVGEGDTTCPPAIHNNGKQLFADGCRITTNTALNNSCLLDQAHIMGPAVFFGTKVRMTQCTFEDMTDRLQEIADTIQFPDNDPIFLVRNSNNEAISVGVAVLNNGSEGVFTDIYDTEEDPDSFETNAFENAWYFDLKDSSNNSLKKLYFSYDKALNVLDDSDPSSTIVQKNIGLDEIFSKLELRDDNDNLIASKDFMDTIPEIEITKASVNGSNLDLEWQITDSSGEDLKSTVLIGDSDDAFLPYGPAFETNGTSLSIELSELLESQDRVKVLVTNGSRSSESESSNFR